ncbi:MAG: glycoside hydrolase family 65 protein, partial [Bacteroidota bacterium]|nr:glycoside hydrolase family 65 protein [Bacteroidota bacterium]
MKIICYLFCIFVILLSFKSNVSIAANKDEEGWILRCDDYNGDYTGAPVANGTIGILPWKEPFSIRHVILNHIFEYSDADGVNKVMQGINPFNLAMTVDGDLIDGKDIT